MSQMHNQELDEDAAALPVAGDGDIVQNSKQPMHHEDSNNCEFFQMSLLHISHTNVHTRI